MSGYDGNGERSPQWWPSRYGADDTLGSGNEITPDRILAALQLPKEGRVIKLAQLLTSRAPGYPGRGWSQTILAHGAMEGLLFNPDGSQIVSFEEHIDATYHIGCHLDGLGHVGIKDRYYNGTHYSEFYAASGLKRFGIEGVRPWIARGICLDVAGLLGTELDAGFEITVDHLEAASDAQGVEIRAGDVVLINTGWGRHWLSDPDRYQAGEPGVGWDGAHWLTDRHVSLVGADNSAFEVLPNPAGVDGIFSVHQHLLPETGTHILENITLTELVESGRSEFLFLLTLQNSLGSTGAMAGPVAVL